MKVPTILSCVFVAVALGAPAINNNLADSEITLRQINIGPCQKCDEYYKQCNHDCGWWPGCQDACACKTSSYLDCKDQCGWTRC
ncbi:hypothetical protein B0J11DRAFT_587206 [Dendryphion nanum]|uniref:Uncharacterized protein n=1 Tax=Dendryphion nanum TaxID=256645 RepID=A0A9P9EJV8_9PLEO|nr:hypothetical protein B0J11DRAFT_587206 [Dendryphion nanum]